MEREDSNTINSLHLTNIHKTTYPTIAESTFLSSTHGIFSKIDPMLGHKIILNKCKNIK